MAVMPRQVSQCPVCDSSLHVTELSCARCDTRLHGVFPPPPLARLATEHQQFLETFVLCRGVIRDVERAMGISYPTVRARLDAAVNALEETISADRRAQALAAHDALPRPSESAGPLREAQRRAVLRQVAEGLIDPVDAAEVLRRL